MRERRRRSKSDDSENRILPKTNAHAQQKKISEMRPKTPTNVTPLTSMPFVQTRKKAALEGSQKTTLQISAYSNVTVRKKVAAVTGIENKAPTDSRGKRTFKGANKPSTGKEKTVGNSSTEPIYKKKLDNNMNAAVDSVFDFESNSQQDVAATSDEPTKDVIEKLVRENKAVVKHKAARKKIVTGSKAAVVKRRVTMGRVTKKIVTRSEAKLINVKFSKASILKTTTIEPIANTEQFVEPEISNNSAGAINEPNGIEMLAKHTQVQDNVDPEDVEEIKDSDNVADINEKEDVAEINDSEDGAKIVESEDLVKIQDSKGVAKSSWSKPFTQPQRLRKTYKTQQRTSPKSIIPQYQSTPVRQTTNSTASPWRVPVKELLNSSDLEFSKIRQIDETKDNMKENEGKTVEQKSSSLKQTNNAKAVSDDIKNCFGFNVDDTDDDDNKPIKDTLPKSMPKIRESLPKIDLSIIETLKDRRREKKHPIGKSETKVIKKPTATPLFKQPKTLTDKQVGNFENADVGQRIEKQKNRVERNKKKVLHQTGENVTQKPSTSNSKSSDDGPILFETNWPLWTDKKQRSYTRVPQQKFKSIMTDDESEAGDVTSEVQRRNKRTKQKEDPKFQEELKKFEEEFNSTCQEVEKYNLVMEVTK